MSKIIIIAEAGVNHNGSMGKAKQLVDMAALAGADYVKFQTYKADNLVTKTAKKAEYQQTNMPDSGDSQYQMLKTLELSVDQHHELIDYCKIKNIKFLSTAFDLESVEFLSSLRLDLWKIPSGEITNYPLLKRIAQENKPVILSTGMSSMEEVKAAVDVLEKYGTNKQQITVLHCNTQYPTPMQDVNLLAMQTIAKELDVKVGYSDHTLGIEVPIAAVALGATVIEKHFTLDRNMEGPDHKASLEPDELKAMAVAIRNIENALGDGEKTVSSSEEKNKEIARKSIVASKFIVKGETLTEENLTIKRPGNGVSPMHWDTIIGKKANRDYDEDELLELFFDQNPFISVIIPVYNVEYEYLVACVESVLRQTYTNLQILIIDDKSTNPDILPLLHKYEEKDSRIVVIEKSINEGVSFTRQHGINIAKGQYLFFMDCDDYITDGCIESLLEEAIQSEADMVIGDHWRTFKTHKIHHTHKYDIRDPNGYVKALLSGKCGGTIWNKLIKTEKIRQLELQNTHLQCNDVIINYIIAEKNFKIKCLGRPVYNWIQRETSMTHTKSKAKDTHTLHLVEWVNNFVLANYGSLNLENELAYYNLAVWALLLAHGLKRPYSADENDFKNKVYTIYWKNKWAKNQFSLKNKLLIQFNQNVFLSFFYQMYAKFLKPLLKKTKWYKRS
jgi:N,N'-diacetyllegionaminate synthase